MMLAGRVRDGRRPWPALCCCTAGVATELTGPVIRRMGTVGW